MSPLLYGDKVKLKTNYKDILKELGKQFGLSYQASCEDWLEVECIKPHNIYKVLRADHKVVMLMKANDNIRIQRYHRRELFQKVVIPKRKSRVERLKELGINVINSKKMSPQEWTDMITSFDSHIN